MVRLQQVEHTLSEKRILGSIDFPNLIYMIASFKDNSNLFMVLQFVSGGEMFSYLRREARLTEEETRFHVSQVLMHVRACLDVGGLMFVSIRESGA